MIEEYAHDMIIVFCSLSSSLMATSVFQSCVSKSTLKIANSSLKSSQATHVNTVVLVNRPNLRHRHISRKVSTRATNSGCMRPTCTKTMSPGCLRPTWRHLLILLLLLIGMPRKLPTGIVTPRYSTFARHLYVKPAATARRPCLAMIGKSLHLSCRSETTQNEVSEHQGRCVFWHVCRMLAEHALRKGNLQAL